MNACRESHARLPKDHSHSVEAIRSAAKQIMALLRRAKEPVQRGGIATGTPGLALLLWQAQASFIDLEISPSFENGVKQLSMELAECSLGATLLTGSPGYIWLLEHLQTTGAFDIDGLHEFVLEHDQALLEQLQCGAVFVDYELLYGLTGVMQYAVCAAVTPTRRAIFNAAVHQLRERSQGAEQGRFIATGSQSRFKKFAPEVVECDLGLAHGLPGTVATLAIARLRGIDSTEVDDLLLSYARYLDAQRCTIGASLFPYSSAQKSESRLAWCYGDLGVANALFLAGAALDRNDISQAGTDIARHAAMRARDSFGTNDAAICHGLAGLILQFSEFYQRTGLAEFGQQRDALLDELMQVIEGDAKLTEHRVHSAFDFPSDDPSLLNGLAGIGLVLLNELVPSNTPLLADMLAVYRYPSTLA